MTVLDKKTPFILLFGDLITFVVSLWVALSIRYFSVPDKDLFLSHFIPFSFLFIIWIIVYFISGLYETQLSAFSGNFISKFFYAQFFNISLAAIFFYFVTFTTLTPKTNLIFYLVISSILILIWRKFLYKIFINTNKQKIIILGDGEEVSQLSKKINGTIISLDSLENFDWSTLLKNNESVFIVFDFYNNEIKRFLPKLYDLLLKKVNFADIHDVYENVFGRTALSLIDHNWFLKNISSTPKYAYDLLKRLMDIMIASVLFVPSIIIYPFVFLAIKFEDAGPVFIIQQRVGKDGKIIRIPKFRSMRSSDRGVWVKENDDRITKVGKFLRASRIDELPQLFSVIKGDMSLVGPRPDILDLGIKLANEIPYYNLRYIIKPGLSGWAQTRQELPPQSLEETKIRLAYDFYYIKNRSFWIDFKIALQTITTLLSRVGK